MLHTNRKYFQCGRYIFPIQEGCRPLVMGILNITPDSFFDGGTSSSLDFALHRAEQMILDGVDIIDIGGESSKPGILPISLKQELKRVLPVLSKLRYCGKPLSIDTHKPQVMYEALSRDVDMINDINGFRTRGAIEIIKNNNHIGLCIMHMHGNPRTMQKQPIYTDIVKEISNFLQIRIKILELAGIKRNQICIDPGFGFGKTVEQNFVLFKNISQLIKDLKVPMLVGLSRKSMIGAITHKPVYKRLGGSLGAAIAAAAKGVMIIRVHDVAETVDALNVWHASQTNLIAIQ